MKNTLTLLINFIAFNTIFSQSNNITYITPNKDTMYVINDELGHSIVGCWKNIKVKPVFIFVKEEELFTIRKKYKINEK